MIREKNTREGEEYEKILVALCRRKRELITTSVKKKAYKVGTVLTSPIKKHILFVWQSAIKIRPNNNKNRGETSSK